MFYPIIPKRLRILKIIGAETMERVINLLHDIEEKANQIVKRANEEKVRLNDQLQKDMEKLDHEITSNNTTKLEFLKVGVDKELNLEKQSLIDECIKQLAQMDADYQEKHSRLVQEIFQEIIKT